MSAILVGPALHRDHGIIVGGVVVTQPKYELSRGLSLVEDAGWVETVLVDFDG